MKKAIGELLVVLPTLLTIACCGCGGCFIVESLFGRSTLTTWIGAALGCLAVFTFFVTHNAASSYEEEIQQLRWELKEKEETIECLRSRAEKKEDRA